MTILNYTASTPNGQKTTIALEELKEAGVDIAFEHKAVSFDKKEQKADGFLKINPNGRIPAFYDESRKKRVFESAACLIYLNDRYDPDHILGFKHGTDEYDEMLQWIFFLQGGLGPMQGQANHFVRYAPESIEYAQKRYINETKRLLRVYESRLAETGEWLVGGKYSYADICTFGWVRWRAWAGVDDKAFAEFPNLSKWFERIKQRPAVKRALLIPNEDTIAQMEKDPSIADKHAKGYSSWIMQGQDEDSKK